MAANQPDSDSDSPVGNEFAEWHEVDREQLPVDPYLEALDNQPLAEPHYDPHYLQALNNLPASQLADWPDVAEDDSHSESFDSEDWPEIPYEPRNDAAQEAYMEEVRQMFEVMRKSSPEEQERYRVDPEYRETILGNPNHRRRIVADYDNKN